MKQIKFLAAGLLAAGLIAIAAGSSFFLSGTMSSRPEKTFSDYMREADVYFKENSFYKAIVSYENALSLEEQNLEALLGLADVYSRQGDFENEVRIRKQIAELYPDEFDNQMALIEALIHLKEYDEAKSRTEALLQKSDSEQLKFLYEQMNVAAPAFNLSGGSYDEYQLLELSENEGTATVHFTVDGSEPTVESPTYTTDGIVISHPETTVRAIAVSPLGFTSEETVLDFEITKPEEELDRYSRLYYLTRDYYYMVNGEYYDYDTVTYNHDAAQIRSVCLIGNYSPDTELRDAAFYEDHYEMFERYETDYGDDDISYLSELPFLHTVSISYQENLDLTPLESLSHLRNLSLLNDSITDLTPLENLTSLERLALGWNDIEDVTPLAGLTQLRSLGLWNNEISDISSLSELKQLEYFDIAHNNVSSIDAVSNMTHLRELWINDNQITSLAPLSACTDLNVLIMAGNPVADYGDLKERTEQLYKTDLGE